MINFEELGKMFKVLDKFEEFNDDYGLYGQELRMIREEVHNFLTFITQGKRNGHYVSCVWADPDASCGPDTCNCTGLVMNLKIKGIINKICMTIGMDCILLYKMDSN